MDWNKTKTIFIIVFSILNVFLYSLYLKSYNEAQIIEPLGDEASIHEKLQADRIKYDSLSKVPEQESYVTGNVRVYSLEELQPRKNQTIQIVDGTQLVAIFNEPVLIQNVQDALSFEEFAIANIENGASYELWEIDEEKRKAVLFQKVRNHLIFNNSNAKITLYWNENQEMIRYEQTEFEELEAFGEGLVNLLAEEEVVKTLYARNLLKTESFIEDITLGYSTLVNFTETQVFAPTWHVSVKSKDGLIEDYFVNAVEGKIIEFEKEDEEEEEVEEVVE